MEENLELEYVVEGNAVFTQRLYNIFANEPYSNIFFSPISAHAVLTLAYQGSKESTEEAFSKCLNIPNKQVAVTGYNELIDYLNTVSKVELLMVNKIYIKSGYNLQSSFKEVAEKKFLSAVECVNFAENVSTANKINAWVEEKTKNKIKNLISPENLDITTRLVLVNAIYFKGTWENKFIEKNTQNEKFYLNEKDFIDAKMMNGTHDYFYKEDTNLDAKILELPYVNSDVSLVIVLPNKKDGIGELEQKLQKINVTAVTSNMHMNKVIVKLPKFKFDTTMDLNFALENLGLGIIFTGNANFKGILEGDEALSISKVIQKAFIEVNEEGTEAAAATGMMFFCQCAYAPPPPPKEFFADHPFVFWLQIKTYSIAPAILFAGKIYKPSYMP